MDSSDLFIMLAGVLMVGSLVFLNIKKITDDIDVKGMQNNQNEKENHTYERFCDFIVLELTKIKDGNEDFDEKIDDFIRQIKHIRNMNTNSSKSVWSQKIAEILMKIDEWLRTSNKELLADALRNKLKDEFSKL